MMQFYDIKAHNSVMHGCHRCQ